MDIDLMTEDRREVWNRINAMMDVGYGCAESFLAAVAEYLWGGVDEQIQMISTGFSGGVGGTHEELCGGVSGAAIVLGMLYGRTTNDEARMIRCKRLISTHRDRFVEQFGTTVCQELRDAQFGADERNPCAAMIAPAAFLLLDLLEEEAAREQEAGAQIAAQAADAPSLEDFQAGHASSSPGDLLPELDRLELSHAHRAWIGDRLAALGDPRPGVGLTVEGLPAIDWLPAAGGSIEVERAGVFPVAPFLIARYPLTARQFQSFVEHPAGFTNPAWWQGMAVPAEHRSAPGVQRFEGANRPRENVSWFDAVAFCRWLTEQVLVSGSMSGELARRLTQDGWVIRLPTEWEWQYAATGGQPDHRFPWGLEWDDRLAHTKHDQLNQTTAVGMYPGGASPLGALDMSGNLWEWCLNCYDEPGNLDLSRSDRRVLRGGSWYHWGSYAHTGMRSRYFPDHRYNAGGFRVLCGPAI